MENHRHHHSAPVGGTTFDYRHSPVLSPHAVSTGGGGGGGGGGGRGSPYRQQQQQHQGRNRSPSQHQHQHQQREYVQHHVPPPPPMEQPQPQPHYYSDYNDEPAQHGPTNGMSAAQAYEESYYLQHQYRVPKLKSYKSRNPGLRHLPTLDDTSVVSFGGASTTTSSGTAATSNNSLGMGMGGGSSPRRQHRSRSKSRGRGNRGRGRCSKPYYVEEEDIHRILFEHGGRNYVNHQDENGKTVLIQAILDGKTNLVRTLLMDPYNANVNLSMYKSAFVFSDDEESSSSECDSDKDNEDDEEKYDVEDIDKIIMGGFFAFGGHNSSSKFHGPVDDDDHFMHTALHTAIAKYKNRESVCDECGCNKKGSTELIDMLLPHASLANLKSALKYAMKRAHSLASGDLFVVAKIIENAIHMRKHEHKKHKRNMQMQMNNANCQDSNKSINTGGSSPKRPVQQQSRRQPVVGSNSDDNNNNNNNSSNSNNNNNHHEESISAFQLQKMHDREQFEREQTQEFQDAQSQEQPPQGSGDPVDDNPEVVHQPVVSATSLVRGSDDSIIEGEPGEETETESPPLSQQQHDGSGGLNHHRRDHNHEVAGGGGFDHDNDGDSDINDSRRRGHRTSIHQRNLPNMINHPGQYHHPGENEDSQSTIANNTIYTNSSHARTIYLTTSTVSLP